MSSTLEKLKRGFAEPQAAYGPIDCWWWEAARLDKEKMRWQLQDLKDKGVAGTWYYPRYIGDEDLACRPRYWTEEWWELTEFAVAEHERLGLAYWFSDWTAHEFIQDKLRAEAGERPDFRGRRVAFQECQVAEARPVNIAIDSYDEVLDVAAFRVEDETLKYDSRIDLSDFVGADGLQWTPAGPGWAVTVVSSTPFDIDYINPDLTTRWIELLLGNYESRLERHLGNTVKAFGTDEWRFMQGNVIYSTGLRARFQDEKGYDPSPLLVGLFRDIGRLTDKIRCQYYEVMCSEIVENLYRPFAAWLEEHNMLFTEFCPRGKTEDVREQTHHYGDFFRYMGSYHIPGNEERCLRGDRVRKFQAKMASSIAHVNGRQRVGLCAYWGSGWGHTPQENMAWTNENYAYGINLYNRHGVLYSTMSGWYEWVPPAVHFRQPYWKYWRTFTEYVSRLSYLLSQGTHRADLAVVYPLATLHANWDDRREFNETAAVFGKAMYDLTKVIYCSGIDFDFVDDTAFAEARIDGDRMVVAGMPFRAILLPPMTTVCLRTMSMIAEFHRAGGVVVAFGNLPTGSDENGRDDPMLAELCGQIFGDSVDGQESIEAERAVFAASEMQIISQTLSRLIIRDVIASEEEIYHTHQVIGDSHLYYLYNHCNRRRRVEVDLDVSGVPHRFDAHTGEVTELHRFDFSAGRTRVRLDMDPFASIPLVIEDDDERPRVLEDNVETVETISVEGDRVRVATTDPRGGSKRVRVRSCGNDYVGELEIEAPPTPVDLAGLWEFQLEPTLNNRWADFRYPASDGFIGPEARTFRYRDEESGTSSGWRATHFDDKDWKCITYSHGPFWWATGPIPLANDDPSFAERFYSAPLPTHEGAMIAGSPHRWQLVRFSKKFGFEPDAADVTATESGSLVGVQPDFLRFPSVEAVAKEETDIEATFAAPEVHAERGRDTGERGRRYVRYLLTSIYVAEKCSYTFDFGGCAKLHRRAWVDGIEVITIGCEESTACCQVSLSSGFHTVLLRTEVDATASLQTYAVFYDGDLPSHNPLVPQLQWFDENAPVYDVRTEGPKVGWFRFNAPPGLKAMQMNCDCKQVAAWLDGVPMQIEDDVAYPYEVTETRSTVALRVVFRSGVYEGAAFPDPVAFVCEPTRMPLGDWCAHGLAQYSGGAVYRRTVTLNEDQLNGSVFLDLGAVAATAALKMNGQQAGVCMAKPFRFDVSPFAKSGDNEIEITVVNTLANHMSTYPTNFIYEGQLVSGLLGPVCLEFHSRCVIDATMM